MSNKSSQSILTQLYENRSLRVKVETLMDEGKSIAYIQSFCTNQGFEISHGSLSNYKKKREESIRTGTPLEHLLDRRANTGNVVELTPKTPEPETVENMVRTNHETGNHDTRVFNTLSFLEDIIQKGMNTIQATDVLDPSLAIKAVDLHHKISGGNGGGLTIYGLEELKIQMKAMETAYTTAIMEFIPEEKHDEVFRRMEEAEKDFYDNLDLSFESRKARETLKDLGIN